MLFFHRGWSIKVTLVLGKKEPDASWTHRSRVPTSPMSAAKWMTSVCSPSKQNYSGALHACCLNVTACRCTSECRTRIQKNTGWKELIDTMPVSQTTEATNFPIFIAITTQKKAFIWKLQCPFGWCAFMHRWQRRKITCRLRFWSWSGTLWRLSSAIG